MVIMDIYLTDELKKEFESYLFVHKDLGKRSVQNGVKVYRWLQKYLDGRPYTLSNCIAELSRLKSEGKKPATRHTIVINMRRVCDFLEFTYQVPNFKSQLPHIKVTESITDVLSSDEIKALYTCQYPPSNNLVVYNLFIETLARTGRRISEICELRVQDINFSTSTFLIRNPKNHIPRNYPLPLDLKEKLEVMCYGRQQKAFVFTTINNYKLAPVKASNIRSILMKRKNYLKISSPVHPHIFRHSFPVELLRRKVPLPIVSELLGHESYKSTKRYTHLVIDDLRIASNFHPLNQENIKPRDLVDALKKEVERYKTNERTDVKFTVIEQEGRYTLDISY